MSAVPRPGAARAPTPSGGSPGKSSGGPSGGSSGSVPDAVRSGAHGASSGRAPASSAGGTRPVGAPGAPATAGAAGTAKPAGVPGVAAGAGLAAKLPPWRFIGAVFLLTASEMGASMLALPIVAHGMGMALAAVSMIALWALMTYTGLMMLEVCLAFPPGTEFGQIGRTLFG
ncbi:MAG: hypothetical protein LBE08_11820, partial [Bifidobacteriaceae bacterium]|nr:hypothetical protein [Bifidobacteriaceae bacterium]